MANKLTYDALVHRSTKVSSENHDEFDVAHIDTTNQLTKAVMDSAYDSFLGKIVGRILSTLGFAIKVWDEDSKKNKYLSVNKIVTALTFVEGNKNTHNLGGSELRSLTTKSLNLLKEKNGPLKGQLQEGNVLEFIRRFRNEHLGEIADEETVLEITQTVTEILNR